LVGLLGAGLTWFMFPARYEAKSWILALSQVPYTVFQTPGGRGNYETFLETQFAIIKSEKLLQEAFADPRLARVKELHKQKDPIRWLQRNIQVTRQGGSEYFTISSLGTTPEDAKAVVDAVTTAYFDRCRKDAEQSVNLLTSSLLMEKTVYESAVKAQQKNLQTLRIQAAEAPPGSEQAQEYAATISFLSDKLVRETQVLNKIGERIVTLQTEVRSPARIILDMEAKLPTEPCDSPLPLAILVGAILFGLTLVGGCVWKKRNP